MFNDTKELWKIWRGIDLSFQNWHKQFDEFWLEHWKVSKIYTLMGCFWPKYIMFELKKVQRSYVWWHWRLMQNLKENWLVLSKMTWRIWQIFTRACSKVWNLGLLLGPFIQSRKCMSLKFTRVLCVVTMKNDTKFEKESTCLFKIDTRNLANFDPSTWKSQTFAL